MADEAIRVQLKCSNCGRVVATVPKDYRLEEALVCPGCGAGIQPRGVIGKIAGEIKDALAAAPGRRENETEDNKKTADDRGQGPEDRGGASNDKRRKAKKTPNPSGGKTR